jgi:hypothetical protein
MYAWRDTIVMAYGDENYLFYDEFDNMDNWTSEKWGLASSAYYSAPYSMADSPLGNYPNNYNAILTLNDTIDLTGYGMAYATFKARWDIERNYDYVQFMVSEDFGATWVPLPGLYTQNGTSYQDQGKPLYHGTQTTWITEKISLDKYRDKQIMIRFRMISDHTINKQGFYFDDFGIAAYTTFSAEPPEIIGQMDVDLPMGETFTMQADMLLVQDPWFNYPESHTIMLHEGDNYSLDGLMVIPAEDFTGNLIVPVTVSNSYLTSDMYPFLIKYFDPLSNELSNVINPFIYYSSSMQQLIFEPGNKFPEGPCMLILYDIFGREIKRVNFNNDMLQKAFPLNLPKGIYLFELKGKETYSGKFPAF